ncbi:MarR family winged helix-turn-helix transcriptional regulator [Duganella sp. CT11-25]|jgi:DNA-binding MarR family transcriptional regulator|uniref:MarR family winged helix-turn-helix transcriptional regulator n=1 Tax=unclassified Duganella TaxID=2636909 RepID=UPI0039AFA516
MDHLNPQSAAAWVKRYYLASRALMETTLRPHDLGSTQWYVLWQLANNGPTVQRDFLNLLQVEKPTLSEIVGALVRKGFIKQTPAADDQRQRLLTITPAGLKLWKGLPDPIDLILKVSFDAVDDAELATVVRVLQGATERLSHQLKEGSKT